MKSKIINPQTDRYKVLEIILNHFLFGKPIPPPLKNKKHYQLDESFVIVFNELDKDADASDAQKLILFFEDFITILLQDKLETDDLLDIVRIYRYSNEKLIINKLIDLQKKSYSFALQNFPIDLTDLELANTLALRRFVPVQIFTFLANRFGAIFSLPILVGGDKITKEKYEELILFCKHNFDIPAIIELSTSDMLNVDRSKNNFFSEKDGNDYADWIRFEIERQPKLALEVD